MTTDEIVIWNNPRCSKSRAALERIEARGLAPRVVRYLDTPPPAEEIARVAAAVGGARALIRKAEPEYKGLGLDDPAKDDDALVAAMAATPRLIERPVVLRGGHAVVGRPTEAIDALL